jgi:hypothetical protein
VDKKERDVDEDENNVADNKRICEVRGAADLIVLGRPCIGVMRYRDRTRACHITDGKLTCTQNSLKSQFLRMISPEFSHLSLSCPQVYQHLSIRS